MPYSVQAWTDSVTPVDKTHMDHIESGIATADTNATTALARVTVPTVVNGQWLKGVGGAAVWSAITAADVGLSKSTTSTLSSGPPGSPADGDIWIALGGAGAGTRWMFQYNSGSGSPYKWEFVGGSPAYGVISPFVVITALVQVGTTGYYYHPSCAYGTVRAGDYSVEGIARMYANGALATVYGSGFAGTATNSDGSAEEIFATTGDERNISHLDTVAAAAASTTIGVAWGGTAAATTRATTLKIKVWPIRIS